MIIPTDHRRCPLPGKSRIPKVWTPRRALVTLFKKIDIERVDESIYHTRSGTVMLCPETEPTACEKFLVKNVNSNVNARM